MMPTAFWILEAAFRSFLMAAAVWAGIRLLRVQAVRAQKLAWALVLLGAGIMPLAMLSPWFANGLLGLGPVKIPLRPVAAPVPAPQPATLYAAAEPVRASMLPKPSPAHRIVEEPATPVILPDFDIASSDAASVPETVRPNSFVAANPPALRPEGFWNWSRIRRIGLTLYLAIAALLLLRMTLGLAVAFRIWRRARPLNHATETASIRVSRDLATPVTIGSTVVLPASYEDWDAAKLRIVLAHEQAHIGQRDFYLQILAALHAAAFWFSPLGWWLQRKLSELGEALSDRAGLAASPSPAAYAQILLEFAAQPRASVFSSIFTGPLTGVPMARTSNLASRIERILNPRLFRFFDLGSRRHAVLAAALVPAALVAVVACIRIVPAVEAAQQEQTPATTPAPATSGQVAPSTPDQVTTTDLPQAATPAASPSQSPIPGPAPNPEPEPAAIASPAPVVAPPVPPAPAAKPAAPRGPFGEIVEPAAPAMPAIPAMAPMPPVPPAPPMHNKSLAAGYAFGQDSGNSFAIVSGDGKSTVTINGNMGKGLEEAKRKYHSNFVWFERGGKSYVITDPAFVAQCEALFQENQPLKLKQAELDRMQAKLQAEMANLKPEVDAVKLAGPEIDRQMAKVQQEIANMHLDKLSAECAQEFSAEEQAELNKSVAELTSEAARARLAGPDFQAQISKMERQLANLQSEEARDLSEKIARQLRDSKLITDEANRRAAKQLSESETEAQVRNAEKLQEQAEKRMEALQDRLGNLEEHIGDIQGHLGEVQGLIGERMGEIGEKQGDIGERMGKLGEEMGKIGEQQGKIAEQASRKVQSLIDQAVQEGKAKPVE